MSLRSCWKRPAASISSEHSEEVYEYTGGLSVPRDVVGIKFHSDVTSVADGAFQGCHNLREVVFNEGLRFIGKNAFRFCASLEDITFPSTLEEIGERAFERCNGLRKLVFNKGLQRIKTMAFIECYWLISVDLSSTNIAELEADVFYKCERLKKVVLNEGIKKMDHTFCQCKSLVDINFPPSLVEIGGYSFASCCKVRIVELNEGIQEIGEGAFWNCSHLERITLPSTITEIPYDAIEKCTNLREVIMLNYEDIRIYKNEYDNDSDNEAKNVFPRCPSLTYISFPSLFSRLEHIVVAGQTQARNKVNDISGVQIRDSKVSISATLVEIQSDYSDEESEDESNVWTSLDLNSVQVKRDQVLEVIAFYEKREATCLFEIAFWKAQISISSANNNPIDREACRIDVPGPIKNAILQYL